MAKRNDTLTVFGVEYGIYYDRETRAWHISRTDGMSFEPIDAPTRDLAILFLGLNISRTEARDA